MIFFTVITFGLIWIKWKKQINHQSNTIFQLEHLPFSGNELIQSLGGIENIENVELKPSRINVFLKDQNLINVELIQNLKGVTGTFLNAKKISIILGEFSKAAHDFLIKAGVHEQREI